MNKITFLLLCIALLWGCSTNHNIDSAIKDIYGSNVPSKEEDGAYIYVLNYLEKENKMYEEVLKKVENSKNETINSVMNNLKINRKGLEYYD